MRSSATGASFLVIGCGSIGKRHIRNLLKLGVTRLLAFDPRADRRTEVTRELGVQAVTELEQAWRSQPKAALIATPTNLHLSLAIEAARHGCHLLIEKPLADRLDGVEELLQLVEDHALVTLVGCNLRFHPGLLQVKRLLEAGAIGRVIAGRAEYGQYLPDWHPSEDYRQGYSARREQGGGILLDGVHELDYIRWMLGEVESLVCVAGKLSHLEIETEDVAAIVLRFASGVIGEVHLDYVQRAYCRSFQIIGDEGTIRWDYNAGEVRWFSATSKTWEVFRNPPGWEPNQMYVDELRHFLRCMAGDEHPTQDVREGARVLELILAAKASSETGEAVRAGFARSESRR